MMQDRIKRIVAIIISFTLMLSGLGEQNWIFASSLSDGITTSQTTDLEKIETDSVTDSNNNVISDSTTDQNIQNTEQNTEEKNTSSEKDSEAVEEESENIAEDDSSNSLSAEQSTGNAAALFSVASRSTEDEQQSGELLEEQIIESEGKPTLSNISTNTLYLIQTYKAWIALANYSKSHNLKNYRFAYNLLGGKDTVYDLASQPGFEGLGSESCPFAGELFSNYKFGNITLQLDKPLFQYLSSDANIHKITISSTDANKGAGLAEHLVAKDNANVTLEEISISGKITGSKSGSESTGNVGGLFADVKIDEGKTLSLQGSSVTVGTNITGETAGGLIGKLNGSIAINLGGFNLSSSQVHGLTNNELGKGCIGGIIGAIEGYSSTDSKLTITNTYNTEFKFERNKYKCNGNSTYCGGFFGHIANTTVEIKCPMSYLGDRALNPEATAISGFHAGAFAGCIDNSNVVLHYQVLCQDVVSTRPSYTNLSGFLWEDYGVGLFAGTIKKSYINVATDFTSNDSLKDAVVIKTTVSCNNTSDNKYQINGRWVANYEYTVSNSRPADGQYNAGFLIGLSCDSEITFSSDHPCKIYSNKVDYTYGNAGGVIGRMVSDTKDCSLNYVTIPEQNQINLMNRSDYAGGLVGKVHIEGNQNVLISYCDFNGKLRFTGKKSTDHSAIIGGVIGGVSSKNEATGKIILNNVKTNFTTEYSTDSKPENYFGGVIGEMNANFEIKNSSFVNTNGIRIGDGTEYIGGLIAVVGKKTDRSIHGQVIGTDTSASPMKVTMPFTSGKVLHAFGGLFGYVGKNSAISLSGYISEEGQKINLTDYKNPTDAGCIVGYQDDALVYMEPDAKIIKSTNYKFDEVGNYGGVIRNKDIDQDEKKLIENFQVTGTLNNKLQTTEDLLRLAIALNTEGYFMPSLNLKVEGQSTLNGIDLVRSAAYTLMNTEYDLTETGLSCLSRNDETGIESPFKGSVKGQQPATIKFGFKEKENDNGYTIHNQPYNGLFSAIDSGTFENLNLQFNGTFESQVFSSGNNSTFTKVPKMEYFGGLAAISQGNISIKNITYTASVTDSSNTQYDSTNKGFIQFKSTKENIQPSIRTEDSYDCIGGLFGRYVGSNNSTLTIDQITASDLNLTCSDYTHMVGGLIGYVDVDQLKKGESCNITLGTAQGSNAVSLSGQINVPSMNSANTSDAAFPVCTGGLIARIGKIDRSDSYDPKCHLTIHNLTMDGFNLKENEQIKISADSEIGGLWGWRWTDVDVCLQTGAIGTTTDSGLSVNTSFGGLVHTISGKMVLNKLTIGDKTVMNAQNDAGVENCGLLIQNGQYLNLDLVDFNITNHDSIVQNYPKSDFDELVGITKGGDDNEHGGIVSIGKSDQAQYYLGRKGDQYDSFVSSHVSNPNTRYYYDLNKLSWSGNIENNLKNADDIMCWHLLHYANAYLKGTFHLNYTEGSIPNEYTIGGTNDAPIDLTGYSLYPTSVNGEQYSGGVLKFNATDLITGEKVNGHSKFSDDSNSQHYQMQTGLFSNVTGLSVSNLKLEGSYSKSVESAGALVSGQINGVPSLDENGNTVVDASGKTQYNDKIKNTFTNITISNLWCVSSKDTFNYDAPIGLMIADITSGAQVSFDTIKMSDYNDSNDTKKAASALIGNVGGNTATYISLSFINMDIADAANPCDTASTKKDQALAKASFIYSYDYADNCSGIYTFTYEDYINGRCVTPNSKYVTLGNELGDQGGPTHYALEEYFDWDYPVGQLKTNESITFNFNCNNYIPYVYKGTKKILINPKSGSIKKGCGTYEDPYVISTTRQLLSLYRYLYEEDQFKAIFEVGQWSMNPVGNDDGICDGSDNTNTGHGAAVTYEKDNKENFPNKSQLSQAYYLISDDIDLTDYPEFTGFGTTDLPFTGVFIGDYSKSDSSTETTHGTTYPKITMPKIPDTNAMADFGFVKFAKGCVVRNLVIHFSQAVSINQKVTVTSATGEEEQVNQGGVGGGVIATVLGGENIIDGVKVSGSCFKPANGDAEIGGYAGRVNAGGLILRNMTSGDVLSGFQVEESTDVEYRYTCGIVGRVLDGYVVYDGNPNNTTQLFSLSKDAGISSLSGTAGAQKTLPQSSSYDILNGSYLEAGNTKPISWDSEYRFGDISTDKQLLVISMALNAGLFNYNANGDYLYDGYNSVSRQRSGDYSYVGNVESSNTESAAYKAREQVVKYDNNNASAGTEYHSYLSQFFNWEDMLSNGESKALNPYDNATCFILTGTDYDMTGYKTAFRGLGGRYFDNNYLTDGKMKSNVFHGKLIGPESCATIQLNMIVDGSHNAEYAALLNNIVKPSGDSWDVTVSNITVSGDVINTSKLITSTNTDDIKVSTTSGGTRNAAAIISNLSNVNLTLQNVLLNSVNVQSEHYAGGMVAVCDSTSGSLRFNNCGISGTQDAPSKVRGCTDTGGFIGYSTVGATISPISKLEYMDVECIAVASSEERKNAGGLIGTIDKEFEINGIVSTGSNSISSPLVGDHITVKTTGDKENVQIGGLVGSAIEADKQYSVSNITLTNLTVENSFNETYVSPRSDESKWIIATGGIVGAIGGSASFNDVTIGSNNDDNPDQTTIQNTSDKIPDHDCYGTGGLVGRNISGSTLTLENCNVLGKKTSTADKTYSTAIKGRGKNVGGMVGNCNTFTGNQLIVDGVTIDAGRYAGGIVSWTQKDYTSTFKDITVKNMSINLAGTIITGNNKSPSRGDVGGVVGYDEGKINFTDISVDSVNISSSYCNNAGGFIGSMTNGNPKTITIKKNQKGNSVKNCLISGQNAGGVFGKIAYESSISSITVEKNKIISCKEDSSITTDINIVGTFTNGTAGGFAGCLYSIDRSDVFVNQLTIRDNLISAYYEGNNRFSCLGGACGYTQSRFVFDDVTLSNNDIGMMKVNTDETGPDLSKDSSFRISTLSKSIDELKRYLYFLERTSQESVVKFSGNTIESTDISEDDFYKYSYLQGAFVGNADTNAKARITKFINVRVIYDEPKYRPVADVGTPTDTKLGSNNAMYDTYRPKCVIAYDGKVDETTDMPTISNSLLKGTTNAPDVKDDVPYVFHNLKNIMDEYTNATNDNRRMAYRLGDNYQNGKAINRESSSELENKTIEQVYQNTFFKGTEYRSPYFKTDGTTQIPMIVYKSSENGKLDEVIQTYINILTNNSGALNSYINKNSARVLSVTPYAMQVKNGVVSQNSTANVSPSIEVKKGSDSNNYIYTFEAPDGDDYTDGQNGTFTLIRIVYGWNYSGSVVTWTLDLPVYVEKRLKITSHMKMLEGIRYNTNTLMTTGKNVPAQGTSTELISLPRGASYSIYSEFIYEDSDKFKSVKVPKCLCIDSGDTKIYFVPKTKFTLIPLDEGGKPYYYEVPETDSSGNGNLQSIDFTLFQDANGNSYTTKDITDNSVQKQDEYKDICSDTSSFTDVNVERFVILADTSAIDSGKVENQTYAMHVQSSPEFKEKYAALYSRTEEKEHCFARVNEIIGVTYKINTSTNQDQTKPNTFLKESSKVTEDGEVGVHLKYNITASPTYWGSVGSTEQTYMDVGFSIAYQAEADSSMVKVPLPSGTVITLGTGENKKSLPATNDQMTAFYYQSLRQAGEKGDGTFEHINELKNNVTKELDFGFDFTNADLSSLDVYSGGSFYVIAQLVVMGDKDLPASGEIKDSWKATVDAKLKADFGFALNVDDLTTIGMNQYMPENSDSGVVTYTSNIAFPNKTSGLESKFYTIIYQIERKTSEKDEYGKPIYQKYVGDKVSLYLGKLSNDDAKSASRSEDSVKSGNGIVAVTYQFSNDQISQGADLTDGLNDNGKDKTANVVKTHCTLVANCAGLNMTNYRVKAYLMVTDSLPSTLSFVNGNAESESESSETAAITEISGDGVSDGCLKKQWLRQDSGWSTVSAEQLKDLKSDYFVFTVAKIKTTM